MLKNSSSRLVLSLAILPAPLAILAPMGALAQPGAGEVTKCESLEAARTIQVVETDAGGCEVRYDRGDGAGANVAWSARHSVSYCQTKAAGLAAKLTASGYSCGRAADAKIEANATDAGPAPSQSGATGNIAASGSISAAAAPGASRSAAGGSSQASPPSDSGDQGDFSFDIAAKPEAPPKPVFLNSIEIGPGWVSQDSAKFGEYSGLNTKGPFLIGNVNIQYRDPYDGKSSKYFVVRGSDLGLESRSVYAEYGEQGRFSIFGFYNSIPKFLLDDARTPYIFRDGGTNLTLPAGWVPSNRSNAGLTLLNSSLQNITVEHQREKAGGGLSWLPGEHWTAKTSYYHETKKGTRTIGAIFGSNGGNPAGAVVPEPVDYETDNVDVSLAYSGKRAQFAFAYNLSLFHDNNDSLIFQNPYASSSWAAPASFPTGFGQLSLPPDNSAHHFTFAGKYLLTSTTRGYAQFTYAHMTQNDPFLPFTINPGLSAPVALPRASLEGEINTVTGVVGLASTITPKLSVKAEYRYENRDNNTPRDVFLVVPGDSQDQGTISDSTARINRPYGRKQNLADVEATYRLTNTSRITLGYQYEQLQRDFTEVKKTEEHKFKSRFQTTPTMRTSAWVGAEYSVRNGSEYFDNLPFLVSATPEHLGPNPGDEFENHPLLRKYYIADRKRLNIQGGTNWTPNDNLNVSVFSHYSKDDYKKTLIGLTESSVLSATGDISYQVSPAFNYRLFYTYERNDYMQTGLSSRSTTPLADLFNLGLLGWNADTKDQVHTAGAGFDWAAIKDKLNFTVDYYFSDAMTNIGLTGGTAIKFGPLPKLKTVLHSVEALAEYQYSERFRLRARYLFSDYNVSDFALDGINPDSMAFIIGLGDQAPNFTVHVVGLSAVYDF